MSPKNLGVTGLFIAFVFALPLFVWSAINVNFNVNENAQGEPNFCGGTCGSNYNCQANFFCFIENGKNEGFCRNPACSSDIDCICNIATASPTIIPTTTTKSSLKPSTTSTPVPKGGNETPNPEMTISPIVTIAPLQTSISTVITTSDLKNQVWVDFGKYLVGMTLFIILCILTFLGIKNYRRNKTHVMPPTNI